MAWKNLIVLITLVLFAGWAFVSWMIRFHIKKYSVTERSIKIIYIIYLAGSALFFGFVLLNAFTLIISLK
jgi:hypothetical protein